MKPLNTKQTALEWGLVELLHLTPATAQKIGLGVHVFVVFLLLFSIGTFLQWRLIEWEEKGCAAYCNCTAQWMDRTYSLDDQGDWQVSGGYDLNTDEDVINDLVERAYLLEQENIRLNGALFNCEYGR